VFYEYYEYDTILQALAYMADKGYLARSKCLTRSRSASGSHLQGRAGGHRPRGRYITDLLCRFP
jgi:hypothetical protein